MLRREGWALSRYWHRNQVWNGWQLRTGAGFCLGQHHLGRVSLARSLTFLDREIHSVWQNFSLTAKFCFCSCFFFPFVLHTGGDCTSMLSFGNWIYLRVLARTAALFLALLDPNLLSCLAAAVHHAHSWHDLISPLFYITNTSISHVPPRGSFWGHRPTCFFFSLTVVYAEHYSFNKIFNKITCIDVKGMLKA